MRKLAFFTAGLGLSGVLLGAFGAHALAPLLAERGSTASWQTAVFYQLTHSVALLATLAWIAAIADSTVARWLVRGAWCWITGVFLFSGSIYVLALGGPRLFGPVTPLGGVALSSGWICVIIAATNLRAQK